MSIPEPYASKHTDVGNEPLFRAGFFCRQSSRLSRLPRDFRVLGAWGFRGFRGLGFRVLGA